MQPDKYIFLKIKRNDTNKLTYKIETDSDFKNEIMIARGRKIGGREN